MQDITMDGERQKLAQQALLMNWPLSAGLPSEHTRKLVFPYMWYFHYIFCKKTFFILKVFGVRYKNTINVGQGIQKKCQ